MRACMSRIGRIGAVKCAVIAGVVAALLAVIPVAEGQATSGWYMTAWVPAPAPGLGATAAAFSGDGIVTGAPYAEDPAGDFSGEGRIVTYELGADGWTAASVLSPPSGMDPSGYGWQVDAEPGRVVASNYPQDRAPQIAVLDGPDLTPTVLDLPLRVGAGIASLDLDGDRIVASTGGSPDVLVLDRQPDGTWSTTTLTAANELHRVAAEGNLIAATGAGAPTVWTSEGAAWTVTTLGVPGAALAVAIGGGDLFTLDASEGAQQLRVWTPTGPGFWAGTTIGTIPHLGEWDISAIDGVVIANRTVFSRQVDGSWLADDLRAPEPNAGQLRLLSDGDVFGDRLIYDAGGLAIVEPRDTPPTFRAPGALTGRVVEDLDLDGVADPDEPGRPGVTLRVDASNEFGTARLESGADGSFTFTDTALFRCYSLKVESEIPILVSVSDEDSSTPFTREVGTLPNRCTTGVTDPRPANFAVADASARVGLSTSAVVSDGRSIVSIGRGPDESPSTVSVTRPGGAGYTTEALPLTPVSNGQFRSAAIDGDRVAVLVESFGSHDSTLHIADRTATSWTSQTVTLSGVDSLAVGAGISVDGDRIAVSSGAVFVVDRAADGTWSATRFGLTPDAFPLGTIDVDGDRIIAANYGGGASGRSGAYLLERGADGAWLQQFLSVPNHVSDVAIEGDLAVLGGEGVTMFTRGEAGWSAGRSFPSVTTAAVDIDGGRVLTDSGVLQPDRAGGWAASWFVNSFDTYEAQHTLALSGSAIVSQGATTYRLDLGQAPTGAPPASIDGRVWFDDDHDGVQDAAETGVPGLGVHVLDPSSQFGSTEVVATETTADGGYRFDSLDGNECYTVFVDLPEAFPEPWARSPVNMGDEGLDSDVDDVGSSWCPAVDGATIDRDAGLVRPDAPPTKPGVIDVHVWFDNDTDGIQDPGEGISTGYNIELRSPDGALIDTAVNFEGIAHFDDLPLDTCVEIQVQPFSSLTYTVRDVGDDEPYADTIDSDTDVDGVLTPWACLSEQLPVQTWWGVGIVPFHAAPPTPSDGIVSGQIWLDSDANGVQDFGQESPVDGVEVTLWEVDWADGDPSPALAATTVSTLGTYKFTGLERDICYQVQVTIPAGHSPTVRNAGTDERVADTLDSDLREDGWLTPYACIASGALRTQSWWDAGLIALS